MCGFVGVIGPERAAPIVFLGLQAIQHRGQDAAGLGTFGNGRFALHKDLGMVHHAIPADWVHRAEGAAGIGHVRYPTIGGGDREDAQPFLTRRPGILLAHNGNITNVPELEEALAYRGFHVLSRCDSEPVLLVLADELTRIRTTGDYTTDDVEDAVRRLMQRVRGSYSVVAVMTIDGQETLLAFRDPHGIRPAVYGRREDGSWMVGSESVALDVVGFEVEGFVEPGHMMLFRPGQEPVTRSVLPKVRRHCIFEQIYFARADSVMESGRVNAVRWTLGERLADEWSAKGLEADVVVAVPDTSRPAAMAMAERLGIPNREGFIKNRYSGRTFIMPDQTTREAALRLKLNPIREVFEGKRVVLLDDSIVRGSTMRRIVKMVRGLNPAAVHVAIFSPPVRNPCFYGIDMPARSELVAAEMAPEEVEVRLADHLGADTVTFLSAGGLGEVGGSDVCAACFTGDYVVPVSDQERRAILKDRGRE